jgi:hypothetical protein
VFSEAIVLAVASALGGIVAWLYVRIDKRLYHMERAMTRLLIMMGLKADEVDALMHGSPHRD